MNKDSEKIFENYLAAGMIPMDKLEEEEAQQAPQAPQAPQPEAEAGAADGAADPGSMLAGIIAEDPNSIAELAGLAEVQQWIQSKSQPAPEAQFAPGAAIKQHGQPDVPLAPAAPGSGAPQKLGGQLPVGSAPAPVPAQ